MEKVQKKMKNWKISLKNTFVQSKNMKTKRQDISTPIGT